MVGEEETQLSGVANDRAEQLRLLALDDPGDGIIDGVRIEHTAPAAAALIVEASHGVLFEALVQAGYNDAVQPWTFCGLRSYGWAREFAGSRRARGRNHQATPRALGNRRLAVRRCLTTGVLYDEAPRAANRHRATCPEPAAA